VTDGHPGTLTVVGIGADGWAGLGSTGTATLTAADIVIGGERQLDLLPATLTAERVRWPSPLRPAIPGLLDAHRGATICVLASGDPMFHGIGTTLVELLGADRVRVIPHPSSVSLATARLGWRGDHTDVLSLVDTPVEALHPLVQPGRRFLVLSRGAGTPGEIAGLLDRRGYASSRLTVLEQLGGPGERRLDGTAGHWRHPAGDPLNVVAVECAADPGAVLLPTTPGLPDGAYDHDGQITKREIRAITVSRLAPVAGQLLWDVGAGSGSIAIEWMRTHPRCAAVAVEADAARAARVTANAATLGVPALRVVTGRAPESLAGLPAPDAVFIGGGMTAPGMVDTCWDALAPGGRLVVNAVTMESEQVVASWFEKLGGDLTRIAVNRASPVGGFTGWRAMMPVTQWVVTK
jgi:precorrin-6Y C5,15-methyltransferase (decarboxylating)